ncbi:Cna B-type domain-containing protein [Proteiniclasticum sp.]|uniref:Cna B-type domain-containing protein n=1 Tax=Proteiniclasticum sp. TaxID=2053595 RepID=UPI002897D821|nr:Cna B-type domain-containing protein [Proteiniclasticum sp.]
MKGKRKIRLVLGLLLTILMVMPGGMIKAEEVEGAAPPAEENVVAPEVVAPAPDPEAVEPVVEEPVPAEDPKEPEVAPVVEPAVEEEKVEVPAVEDPPVVELETAEPQNEPPLEAPMKSAAVAPADEKAEVNSFEDLEGDYKWGENVPAEGTEHDAELGWVTDALGGAEAARGGFPHFKFGVIEISKVWMADRKEIPKAVAFKLYADGKLVGVLPILSSKDWKTKLVVPVKIGDHVISYSIQEMPIKGFRSTVKGLTITNQQMRYLSVKKVWIGDEKPEEKYDFRPESVTYRLKANGRFFGEERTLTEAKGWKEFIEVPAYDSRGKIRYDVVEQKLEGYKTKVEFCKIDKMYKEEKHEHDEKCADFIIMNIFTNKKDLTLTKVWDDNNNPERPSKVMFELYQNDKFRKTVNISAKDGWKAVVSDFIYDRDWNEYVYTVGEENVPEGYRARVDGLTITNKLIEMVEVKGEKFWWDNGRFRPESVMVKLMANGEFVKELEVLPDESGRWLYDFGKYPKYDEEDKPIAYELVEEEVRFYTTKVEGFNIYNQQWRWLSVKKIWEHDWAAEKYHNMRPDMVKYQLMLDGKPFGEERTLTEKKNWTDMVWVPGFDADGLIEYEVHELHVEGYTTRYEYLSDKLEAASRVEKNYGWRPEITIINTFTNKKHIELKKIWDDNNNEARPEEVTFTLYGNGKFVKDVVLTEEGEWSEHLEVFIFGWDWKPIKYTVEEKVVPEGYKATVDGLTITNRLIEMVEVKGEKFWWDNGKFRPESVMVKLMANGEFVKELEVMPDESGRWLYDFGKYPKYDEEDKPIAYELVEEEVRFYTTKVEGFNIYNQQWRWLSVKKIWEHDWAAEKYHNMRPDMVKYQLMLDGKPFGEERTLTEKKNWTDMVWVPGFDADGLIEYEVHELHVEGYTTRYEYLSDKLEAASRVEKNYGWRPEITIINTFTNKKHIELKKIWDDNNNEARPEEVTFTLYGNGKFVKDVVLTEEGEWSEHLEVFIFGWDWKPIKYTVEEKDIPEGYEATVDGLTITNKLIKLPEMEEIKGEKTWLDDGTGRPLHIMVKLMANGELKETKKVMPVDGKWFYDFGKMPKYDDEDKLIVYTIMEEPVEGYEMIKKDGYDIANRRVEIMMISGEKTWDDLMNRPSEITVHLHRNGELFKEMVVKPNEAGKWLYEFKELAKFDEMGKPYVYTISEKEILFYDAHVTGYNIHNYQQRATLKILKVNKSDVVLPGAVFEIYDVMGKLLKTATTGVDGTITMVLPLGAYRIKELSPPTGYKKLETTTMAMLLKDGEVVTVEIENEFLEFDDVSPKPLPETPVTPTRPTLPSTGSAGGNAFYLFGMASVAFGLFNLKRKKV